MSNNEKFNARLNSCAHSRQIYNMLLAWAAARSPLESIERELEDTIRQSKKEAAANAQ